MRRVSIVTLALALLSACSAPPPAASPPPQEKQKQPEFVGKTWVATDPAAAPGTFLIFLPDGTLVMDSCWETYRLARWRAIDDRRIEWTEDTARLESQITRLTDEELQLRLQLVGEVKDETYRLAQVPWVCPDMPK